MSEFTYERLRENLEHLKMKNTLEILDNYLEKALRDNVNVVEILDHIFSEEARSRTRRAVEKQIHVPTVLTAAFFCKPYRQARCYEKIFSNSIRVVSLPG